MTYKHINSNIVIRYLLAMHAWGRELRLTGDKVQIRHCRVNDVHTRTRVDSLCRENETDGVSFQNVRRVLADVLLHSMFCIR